MNANEFVNSMEEVTDAHQEFIDRKILKAATYDINKEPIKDANAPFARALVLNKEKLVILSSAIELFDESIEPADSMVLQELQKRSNKFVFWFKQTRS